MEAAIAIIIALQTATIGWLLYHSSQCSAFHERVASLEEWKRFVEREKR
jgi:hypothetical protein